MAGIALIFRRQIERPRNGILIPDRERITPIRPGTTTLDSGAMQAMMHEMRHRGPDGSTMVSEDCFVLGFHRFTTTLEGAHETQPVRDAWGATYVAFDGRLDNRQELGRRLGLRAPGRSQMSDASLVMAAWDRYDVDCFQYFEGAFAIVILDMRRNRAVVARDPLGLKNLYYRLTSDKFLVASEEQALLSHPDVSERVNQTRLAQHLAFEFPSDGSTFFEDITQVQPGQWLCVDSGSIQHRQYFDPLDITPVRYSRLDEYAEHYLELLRKSVRATMRAAGAPALMLSGGLDSTTIAALMGEVESDLNFFSWRFNELESCDESQWINEMAAHVGGTVNWVDADDCWPLKNLSALEVQDGHPLVNPYRELKSRTYLAAARSGHRVLLTGVGGDELYLEDGVWLRDQLREGNFAAALTGLKIEACDNGWMSTLRGGAIRHALGLSATLNSGEVKPRWLTDEAWERVRDQRRPLKLEGPLAGRERQFNRLFGSLAAEDAARECSHDSRSRVEIRSAFRNVELARYVLSIPAWTIHEPGKPRQVLRRAMRDLLPISITQRQTKTSFIDLFRLGLHCNEVSTVEQLLGQSGEMLGLHLNESWTKAVRYGKPVSAFEEAVYWNCLSVALWQQKRAGAIHPVRLIA